jgi:hypothetical protein
LAIASTCLGSRQVGLRVRRRHHVLQVQGHRQLGGIGQHPAQRRDRAAVRQVQVVRHGIREPVVLEAGGVLPRRVAQVGRAPRLVERRDRGHPVAELLAQHECVVGEAADHVSRSPPALVLERLRQVPVVQRHQGLDPPRQQAVDELLVEVDPGLVDVAAVGHDPRPGDREPVRRDAEVGDQVQVLRPPVVVVAGDVAGVAAVDLAGRVGERVPDAGESAVLGDGPSIWYDAVATPHVKFSGNLRLLIP